MTRVTIKDVAKRSGFSRTAVSFAFNDPSRLPETTVQKILSAANELGYRPHPIARSLNTGRIGVVGLLLPQDIPTILENPFYIQFARGIGRVCDQESLSLMLVPPVKGSMLNAVNHAAVDGFVVVGLEPLDPVVNILRQQHVPFVMVDSEAPEDVPCIKVDDIGGARAAMLIVLEHGHRRIAIVTFESGKERGWREYTGTLNWRMQGYADALATAGLTLSDPEIQVIECENSIEGGANAFARVWAGPVQPTSVVAMSDIIALGVMNAARERGIGIPRDLAVVGYDDILDAERADPPLTTVRQPIVEKGEQAAELLLQVLENEAANEHRTLPTELIVRRSV